MLSSEILQALVFQGMVERLKSSGVTEQQLDNIKAHYWKPELLDSLDTWSRQYLTRGHIWGNNPSKCGEYLISNLPAGSRVLEYGCGYGRDAKISMDNGLVYEGLDNSKIAVWETMQQLDKGRYNRDNSNVSYGNIVTTSTPSNYFDAVFAHRVLHIPDPIDLPAIINRAFTSLKSDGQIAFTLRSQPEKDHPDWKNMNRLDSCTAEYTIEGRKGHKVHFYDEENLKPLFSKMFTDLSFEYFEEPESFDNLDIKGKPILTKLVLVTGRKNAELESKNKQKRSASSGSNENPNPPLEIAN